jgi:hypothetical protein
MNQLINLENIKAVARTGFPIDDRIAVPHRSYLAHAEAVLDNVNPDASVTDLEEKLPSVRRIVSIHLNSLQL